MAEMMPENMQNRVVMDDEGKLLARRYQWLLELMRNDDVSNGGTGSLRTFVQDARREIKASEGNIDNFRAWWNDNWSNTEWYKTRTSARRESEVQRADPKLRQDYELSLERRRNSISNLATRRYGIVLTAQELEDLTEEARLNQWDEVDLDTKLRPFFERALATGAELGGTAGDFQNELTQWASRNGLAIDRSMLSKYVGNMTLGQQTLDDVKQELRTTYLMGAYPAWADRIEKGFDPEAISRPYRSAAAKLLEVEEDEISLDDPLLKRGLQGTGADGKPRVVPLYEFESEIRKDPRWDKTNNAYETYTKVGTDLLRMFGLR